MASHYLLYKPKFTLASKLMADSATIFCSLLLFLVRRKIDISNARYYDFPLCTPFLLTTSGQDLCDMINFVTAFGQVDRLKD